MKSFLFSGVVRVRQVAVVVKGQGQLKLKVNFLSSNRSKKGLTFGVWGGTFWVTDQKAAAAS